MTLSIALTQKYSRVHQYVNSPIIHRRAQTALGWRLEGAAVWVLRDITSLVVDDSLDKRCQLRVLRVQVVVLGKLRVIYCQRPSKSWIRCVLPGFLCPGATVLYQTEVVLQQMQRNGRRLSLRT